jgi:hypothetical protein
VYPRIIFTDTLYAPNVACTRFISHCMHHASYASHNVFAKPNLLYWFIRYWYSADTIHRAMYLQDTRYYFFDLFTIMLTARQLWEVQKRKARCIRKALYSPCTIRIAHCTYKTLYLPDAVFSKTSPINYSNPISFQKKNWSRNDARLFKGYKKLEEVRFLGWGISCQIFRSCDEARQLQLTCTHRRSAGCQDLHAWPRSVSHARARMYTKRASY